MTRYIDLAPDADLDQLAADLEDDLNYELAALEPALQQAQDADRDLRAEADRIDRRLVQVDHEISALAGTIDALQTAGTLLASGMHPGQVRAELHQMRQHRPSER